MINNTKKIKELYENIQRKLFDIVPGKWDELYLYASIIERLGKVQVGEMYFYFMPRGILKRKFINVYEVPNKYNIEEEEYLKLVIKREEEGSTGVGEGIAIPHGKGGVISEPGLAAMVIPDGVDFESLDGKPVKLLFLIAAPNSKDNLHLEVLSRLSALLMNEKFRKDLLKAKNADDLMKAHCKYSE